MTQKVFLTTETGNQLFYGSLAGSFVVHVALIAGSSLFAHNVKIFEKPARTIEVTYDAIKNDPPSKPQNAFKDVQLVKAKESPAAPPVDVKALSRKHDEVLSSLKKDSGEVTKSTPRVELNEKNTIGVKSLGGERKITVPLLHSEKITDPKYLHYTRTIRHKIEKLAYYYARNSDLASGEVYMTFVLSSSGSVGGVKIIPEKTRSNASAQNIGVRSVQDAGPFESFPSGLAFPELTFNVIISFELEQ